MTRLKLITDNTLANTINKVQPWELAFDANELYVHIATKFPESQFKENMLEHINRERAILIEQVADHLGKRHDIKVSEE